jgi:RNA polymerase sigma factor (sigma-70 family)
MQVEMAEQDERITDELLVMECQDGSVQALDQLVSRWQRRLWRYAYRLTGDAEAAWDVTQESWLGVIRGLQRLNDPARFRPWIYQIVTHKADDWIARNAKTRQRRAEMKPEEPEESQRQDREESDEFQSLMRGLPDQSKTVLTLYYLEGLPIAEVAKVLNIPEGTVKSRLHAARNELKTLWQQASK